MAGAAKRKRLRDMTFNDHADQYRGQRASSLLKKATGRLLDLAQESGREDMVELVLLLTDHLARHPGDVRAMRPKLVEILASDDFQESFVQLLEQDQRAKVQARDILRKAAYPKG